MTVITASTIAGVWRRAWDGDDIAAELAAIGRAARHSRGSREALAALHTVLGRHDRAEWAAWLEVINTWSHGFPPGPAHYPTLPDHQG